MTDMLPPSTHILVVDDDSNLLLLLTKMLTRIGAKATTVETGNECLSHLENDRFDLLILDLMLPDISGFDILMKIRQDSRFDALPVLILSAKADPDAISQGLALGADGYLTKPYLPNTLTSRVRTLLEHRQR